MSTDFYVRTLLKLYTLMSNVQAKTSYKFYSLGAKKYF